MPDFTTCRVSDRHACYALARLMGGEAMIGKNKQRWEELCAQAAVEQDPERLFRLITEINELLAAKSKRLTDKEEPPQSE
jgi:hypothetical protein